MIRAELRVSMTGPLFGFSNTWQLIVNTGTTIVSLLMVFLIQNSQNRDTEAMQIKLDELIRATRNAHNALLDLEELDEKVMCRLRDARRDPSSIGRVDAPPDKGD